MNWREIQPQRLCVLEKRPKDNRMDTGEARRGNCSVMLIRKYVLFGKDSENWLGKRGRRSYSNLLHMLGAWLSSVAWDRDARDAQGIRTGMARRKCRGQEAFTWQLILSCSAPSLGSPSSFSPVTEPLGSCWTPVPLTLAPCCATKLLGAAVKIFLSWRLAKSEGCRLGAEAAVFVSRLASRVRYLGCQISLRLFSQASTPSCPSVGWVILFLLSFFLPFYLGAGHQQVCFLVSAQGVCFEDNFSPFSYWKNVRNEAPWPQPSTQPGCVCTRSGRRARCLQPPGADSDPASAAWWAVEERWQWHLQRAGVDSKCRSEHLATLENTWW